MRLLQSVVLALSLLAASAQENPAAHKQKHDYQSDVARLRKIVINSLYSHKEVFLRELISNANDAIEKLRLTSLKDKSVWDGANPLNITIKAVKDEDGKSGRIIITGMYTYFVECTLVLSLSQILVLVCHQMS
jgi:heat shock protein beta